MTHCKLSRVVNGTRIWTHAKIEKPAIGKIVTIAILTDTGKMTDEGRIIAEMVKSDWEIMEIYE